MGVKAPIVNAKTFVSEVIVIEGPISWIISTKISSTNDGFSLDEVEPLERLLLSTFSMDLFLEILPGKVRTAGLPFQDTLPCIYHEIGIIDTDGKDEKRSDTKNRTETQPHPEHRPQG